MAGAGVTVVRKLDGRNAKQKEKSWG